MTIVIRPIDMRRDEEKNLAALALNGFAFEQIADDRKAAHSNDVHLQGNIIGVVRRTRKILDCAARQQIEILNPLNWRFQKIEQSGHLMNPMLPYQLEASRTPQFE